MIGILIALCFIAALVVMYSKSMVGRSVEGGPHSTLEGVRERAKEFEAGQADRLRDLERQLDR